MSAQVVRHEDEVEFLESEAVDVRGRFVRHLQHRFVELAYKTLDTYMRSAEYTQLADNTETIEFFANELNSSLKTYIETYAIHRRTLMEMQKIGENMTYYMLMAERLEREWDRIDRFWPIFARVALKVKPLNNQIVFSTFTMCTRLMTLDMLIRLVDLIEIPLFYDQLNEHHTVLTYIIDAVSRTRGTGSKSARELLERYMIVNHESIVGAYEGRVRSDGTRIYVSPILYAVKFRRLEVDELVVLLNMKMWNLEARDEVGWRALDYACSRGHGVLIGTLLMAGARIEDAREGTSLPDTELMLAVRSHDAYSVYVICYHLLSQERNMPYFDLIAYAQRPDVYGHTALGIASRWAVFSTRPHLIAMMEEISGRGRTESSEEESEEADRMRGIIAWQNNTSQRRRETLEEMQTVDNESLSM